MKIWLAVVFCVLPVWAEAEIYKWVDDDGQVHYGAKPPQTGSEQTVDLGNYRVSPEQRQAAENRLDKSRKLLRAFEEERQFEEEQAREREQAERDREKHAAQCRKVKKQRDAMQAGGRWYTSPEPGERQWLSEEDVAAQIKRMTDDLQKHCKGVIPL